MYETDGARPADARTVRFLRYRHLVASMRWKGSEQQQPAIDNGLTIWGDFYRHWTSTNACCSLFAFFFSFSFRPDLRHLFEPCPCDPLHISTVDRRYFDSHPPPPPAPRWPSSIQTDPPEQHSQAGYLSKHPTTKHIVVCPLSTTATITITSIITIFITYPSTCHLRKHLLLPTLPTPTVASVPEIIPRDTIQLRQGRCRSFRSRYIEC